MALAFAYRPPREGHVPIHLFRERDTADTHPLQPCNKLHLPDAGWLQCTGRRPQIHWLEAGHGDVMQPGQVEALAAAIHDAVDAHYRLVEDNESDQLLTAAVR